MGKIPVRAQTFLFGMWLGQASVYLAQAVYAGDWRRFAVGLGASTFVVAAVAPILAFVAGRFPPPETAGE